MAGFLEQRGRVSIADLAARSSELIDLEPKAAAGAKAHAKAAIDFDAVLAD